MKKSIGERGHPCLSPLEALKKSVALPFTRGAIHGFEMHAQTHLMKFSPLKENYDLHDQRHLLNRV